MSKYSPGYQSYGQLLISKMQDAHFVFYIDEEGQISVAKNGDGKRYQYISFIDLLKIMSPHLKDNVKRTVDRIIKLCVFD